MAKKSSYISTKQVVFDSLSYLLKSGLSIKKGHLPQPSHRINSDFFGVCVASNENPATDAYVMTQLKVLDIKNVRLDFTYTDLGNCNARFLQALIDHAFNVTLRLIIPFDAAKKLHEPEQQQLWKAFLSSVLNRYGAQITQVEIGNTINRKRWAGYTMKNFLSVWQIAHTEIKSRGIKLLGPNIQDFEPVYNITVLKALQARNQLPNVHTNNLFVERVSEPERYDHRIFKYRWVRVLKYNLVKKARILQKIGQDFGVAYTSSSAAFWAIYRIERLIENGPQKQADYLTRYFALLAASGALLQANWGTLICNREGLIDDGLTDAEYPSLERITHYKTADGELSNYARYPSFYAMQTVVKHLSDAYYESAIATTNGLEIHHFSNHKQRFHVAWTINGKAARLVDIYDERTLKSATLLHRDGQPLKANNALITETPLYLFWDKNFTVNTVAKPVLAKDLTIHRHIEDNQYFVFNENGWQGLVLAKNESDAAQLLTSIHPEKLNSPQKIGALRHARNVIWAAQDPRDTAKQLTIKQPVKMYPHKAFLDRFKPSKAKRSWNGTMELLRRGIATAQPIAYFEKVEDKTLKQNFYLCEYVASDCTIGHLFSAFKNGESSCLGLSEETVYKQFSQFCHKIHRRGIYFRDFSGGNILVNIHANNQLTFSLIDTARLRAYSQSTALKFRIADLTRACYKLHKQGRKHFMCRYLGLTGRKFTLRYKIPFYLYDIKIGLKRTIGRKGIKRLVKWIKGKS